MSTKILIPYNFTGHDEKAVDFAGYRYGEASDVSISLFHAFTPIPEIDARNNPIMDRMNQSIHYLRQRQEDLKSALGKAGERLFNFGFTPADIHCLFKPLKKDVANDIILLWEAEKFDFIVMSRTPGNIINYFSRSTSERISNYKDGIIKVHIVN